MYCVHYLILKKWISQPKFFVLSFDSQLFYIIDDKTKYVKKYIDGESKYIGELYGKGQILLTACNKSTDFGIMITISVNAI